MAATSSARLIQLIHCLPLPSLPRIPKRQRRASRSSTPPSASRTIPVRMRGTRMPAASAGCGGRLPGDDDLGQEAGPGRAGLGELLVAAVAVHADGGPGDEHRWLGVQRGERLGEQAGALRPALEDLALLLVGPALLGDALAGEVHDAVETLETGRVDVAALDVPRHGAGGRAAGARRPHDAHHLVAVGLERSGQRHRRSGRSTR